MEWVSKKEEVVRAGVFLVEHGLVSRTWGNISVRQDDKWFSITPSGKSYDDITCDDIVDVSMETLEFQGDIRPSSEKGLHKVIYDERKEAMAIVHTHQRFATALSVLANGGCSENNGIFCGELITQDIGASFVQYAMSGTEKLVENTKKVLKNAKENWLILANHGVCTWGVDLKAAMNVAIELEKKCEEILKALNVCWDKEIILDYKKERNSYYCYNNSAEIRGIIKKGVDCLDGYIDDFGQIVGEKVTVDEKKGVFLKADNLDDLKAMNEITSKNALACQVALAFGANPIATNYLKEMRKKYVEYYSKLK